MYGVVLLAVYVFASPGTVLAALVSTPTSSSLHGDKCPRCLAVLGIHSQLLGPAEAELHVAISAHVDTVHGIAAIPPPLLSDASINNSNTKSVDRVQDRCQWWADAVSLCWKGKYPEISRREDRQGESDSESNEVREEIVGIMQA